ncbi:MAG: phosphoribosylanthranilate isomerase [Sediminibacterium sp.]|nr:phosphoribosylanthranilate isomerase [Sediminibacterium sp.]
MKIKICGLCLPQQIQNFDQLKAGFLGMIFYAPSPRYILAKLNLNQIKQIECKNAQKVAVFVDENIDIIDKILTETHIKTVQLHGTEAPKLCAILKQNKVSVIKTFSVHDDNLFPANIADYNQVCDYFLFDTKSYQKGGSGLKFNWDILFNLDIKKPFFLSGGIGFNDFNRILMSEIIKHPYFSGLDINSRFEWTPGLKNTNKVYQFISSLEAN